MTLSLKEAARQVLIRAGEPLHYEEITRRVLDGGLSQGFSTWEDLLELAPRTGERCSTVIGSIVLTESKSASPSD